MRNNERYLRSLEALVMRLVAREIDLKHDDPGWIRREFILDESIVNSMLSQNSDSFSRISIRQSHRHRDGATEEEIPTVIVSVQTSSYYA